MTTTGPNIRVLVTCETANRGRLRRAFDCEPAFAASCTEVIAEDDGAWFQMSVTCRTLYRTENGVVVYELVGRPPRQSFLQDLKRNFPTLTLGQQLRRAGALLAVAVLLGGLAIWLLTHPAAATVGWLALNAHWFLALAVGLLLLDLWLFWNESRLYAFAAGGLAVLAALLAAWLGGWLVPDLAARWSDEPLEFGRNVIEHAHLLVIGASPWLAILFALLGLNRAKDTQKAISDAVEDAVKAST